MKAGMRIARPIKAGFVSIGGLWQCRSSKVHRRSTTTHAIEQHGAGAGCICPSWTPRDLWPVGSLQGTHLPASAKTRQASHFCGFLTLSYMYVTSLPTFGTCILRMCSSKRFLDSGGRVTTLNWSFHQKTGPLWPCLSHPACEVAVGFCAAVDEKL